MYDNKDQTSLGKLANMRKNLGKFSEHENR